MTRAFSRASRPGPGGSPTAERQPPLGRVREGPELSMVSARGSQGGRRGSPCPRIRALWEKVQMSRADGDCAGKRQKARAKPVPGLGSVRSPGGILGQGWGGRGCSASRWGHPIPPGDGHLLGLRCILPTVRTEDHSVQLGHTGLVEAVGHTEVGVTLQEGALGAGKQRGQVPGAPAPVGACLLAALLVTHRRAEVATARAAVMFDHARAVGLTEHHQGHAARWSHGLPLEDGSIAAGQLWAARPGDKR